MTSLIVLFATATSTLACPNIPLDQPLSQDAQAVFCVAMKASTKLGECRQNRASDAQAQADERKQWVEAFRAVQAVPPTTKHDAGPTWLSWAGPLGVGAGLGVALGGGVPCFGPTDCDPLPGLATGGALVIGGLVLWLIEEVSNE